jgi:DNA relaxase NicK
MQQAKEAVENTVLSVGVDWLTCTTLHKKSSKKIMALAEDCMTGQQRLGNEVRGWGMSGFDGLACGQIQAGTRCGEALIRLTGEYAASNWRRFYSLADNVSRIDLQVTIDTHQKASTVVAKHYGQAARARKKSGRFPKVWECRDSDGPATLYFGKRVSDLFARVYDKFGQAGDAWPPGSVRYELQCNRRQAIVAASRIYESKSELPAINHRVWSYFNEHALRPLWPSVGWVNYSCPRRRSDLERRLVWLNASVRPSVMLLKDAGKLPEVLIALGLSNESMGQLVQFPQTKTA